MPLVDIGGNTETYKINGWTANAGYSVYSTETPSVNTINNLGTMTNNSTDGFFFTASQRCRVTLTAFIEQSATVSIGIAGGPSTIDFAGASILAADKHGYRLCILDPTISATITPMAGTCVLEPGDVIGIGRQVSTSNVSTSSYAGGASLVVEKDYSHTNMAHIIKPAVAQAREEVAQNTSGGTATTGSWQIRTINKLEGETWFVTLASNKLTFEPGTYKIQASAFFTNVNECKIMLYDNTNSKVLKYGQNGYNSGAGADAAQRWVSGFFTFTESTDVYIKYWTSNNNGTCDLGQPNNFSGVPEIYLNCLMEKLK